MDWTSPAPAKVNLCLTITGRRPDGYHNLVSLAAFTQFGDHLTISDDAADGLTFTGPFAADLDSTKTDNLLLKTKAAVLSAGFSLPEHHIYLDKQIPVSSGLGGGSSDVAAYLRCIADMMTLNQTDRERLFALGGQIGADVPVCLCPGYQLMTGTGTDVEQIDVEDGPVFCVLSNPGVAVSTQAVFSALNSQSGGSEVASQPLSSPVRLADMVTRGNDLYAPASEACPEISTLLAEMGELSAPDPFIGLAMSGSGASCFALTYAEQAADRLTEQLKSAGYWAVSTQLISS